MLEIVLSSSARDGAALKRDAAGRFLQEPATESGSWTTRRLLFGCGRRVGRVDHRSLAEEIIIVAVDVQQMDHQGSRI